jgi:signal transduction histidine kinase
MTQSIVDQVPEPQPAAVTQPPADTGLRTAWRPPRFGLSGKLLILTILFVMITEVLVYVPSIANFRINWLNDRLAAAHTAALVLQAAPSGMVPEGLQRDILESIGAKAVAMKMGDQRRLLAVSDPLPAVDNNVDLRTVSWTMAVMNAFKTLFWGEHNVMRVVANAPQGGEFIEIVMHEAPLRSAMLHFSVNVLLLSLFISAMTAALVYFSLHHLFVQPMRRITDGMISFRREPENPNRIMAPSARRDEIGDAERELAAMQTDIASMLHQKSRLAALGLAVSKINHDLRNLLASAQLFSDRLAGLPDPGVQRFAPKLMRALERAIGFCQSTLSYGRAQEPAPERRQVALEPLVEEVRENLGLTQETGIRWVTAIERGLWVDADPEQLFRVIVNLGRNAVQALEQNAPNERGRDQIRIVGRRENSIVVIEISDTGPGVPPRARAHLFEAFRASTRSGGVGLGLVIAAELVRAHGGDIDLVEGTIGATFRITIPDRPVELSARRDRARA